MAGSTPFVFVHGLFGALNDPAIFEQLTPARCSAPDLIGYGAKTKSGAVTIAGQVRALEEHVDAQHPSRPVHLVAQSIGAVYALIYADMHPDRVASLTTVEGNFSLSDAFWSQSIAAMDGQDAAASVNQRLGDPEGFLVGDGITPDRVLVERARDALAYQPWETVWESARAIVAATGFDSYEHTLKRVFGRTAVYLVSGARSTNDWHVPAWAAAAASGSVIVAGVGHMMMLEDPEGFGKALATLSI